MAQPHYPEPLYDHVRMIVSQFDANRREAFEERAAIVQYYGHVDRAPGLPRHPCHLRPAVPGAVATGRDGRQHRLGADHGCRVHKGHAERTGRQAHR